MRRSWRTLIALGTLLLGALQAAPLCHAASLSHTGTSLDRGIPPGWPGNAGQPCTSSVWADNKISLWRQVVDIAGVGAAICAPAARYAAFVPSDAAVQAFFINMGFTKGMADLKQRPGLAKELVAMHLVLALPPDAQQKLSKGEFTVVSTESRSQYSGLTVKVGGGGVVVTDGQGNAANVLKVVKLQNNKTAIILDKVLFSGRIYTSFASLCNHRTSTVNDMCIALLKSGTLYSLSVSDFANTVFFPGNRAFIASPLNLKLLTDSRPSANASRAALINRIRYHVVPGLHPIPEGFKNASWQDTLFAGKQLQVMYQSADNGSLEAFVLADAGQQKVPVVVTDVYVGQAVVHGITAVLQPPTAAAQAAAPAASTTTASATTTAHLTRPDADTTPKATTKPAAGAAETSLTSTGSATAGPGSAGESAAAAAAEAAKAQGKASLGRGAATGRRLFGTINELQKVTLPLNAAETDIRARVRKMTQEQDEKW